MARLVNIFNLTQFYKRKRLKKTQIYTILKSLTILFEHFPEELSLLYEDYFPNLISLSSIIFLHFSLSFI